MGGYGNTLQKRKAFRAGIFMLAIFMVFLLLSAVSAEASSGKYGDLDGDGRVDVRDVVLVMHYILGHETLDVYQLERADVSGSGAINVQDASLIMQKVLAVIDYFPVELITYEAYFMVNPGDNTIRGYDWQPGHDILVSVEGREYVVGSNWKGEFKLDHHQHEDFTLNLQAGQKITVSDGVAYKTHAIRNLEVTGLDTRFDLVHGSAPAGSRVEVRVFDPAHENYNHYPVRTVRADAGGKWSADFFGRIGFGPGESAFDITDDSRGEALIYDQTNDATVVNWRFADNFFEVFPQEGWVSGFEWAPNANLTITVGSREHSGKTNWFGYFEIHASSSPGETVRVTDGDITREHIVMPLNVTGVNREKGIVSGFTQARTTVTIQLIKPQPGRTPPVLLDVKAARADRFNGNWIIDFYGEIEDDVVIYVIQTDDDGDRTVVIR